MSFLEFKNFDKCKKIANQSFNNLMFAYYSLEHQLWYLNMSTIQISRYVLFKIFFFIFFYFLSLISQIFILFISATVSTIHRSWHTILYVRAFEGKYFIVCLFFFKQIICYKYLQYLLFCWFNLHLPCIDL